MRFSEKCIFGGGGGGGGIINHKTGLFSILFYFIFYFIFFLGGGYFYAFKGNFIRAGYRMGNLVWGSDLYRSLFGVTNISNIFYWYA